MGRRNRNNNIRKKLLITSVLTIAVTLFVVKMVGIMSKKDVDEVLKDINKEIQSVPLLSKKKTGEDELYQNIESLANDILKQQEIQAKEIEKQNRNLEKKINALKQAPIGTMQTLREKLAYQFEYDSSKKFPAFIWKINTKTSSKKKADDKTQNALDELNSMWKDKNPGFVHELFDNEEIIKAMILHHYSNIPEIIEAYQALPSDILKVDYFKFLLLLARGGTYVDSDTTPLVPIPNWIPETMQPKDIGLIIGIEHDSNPDNWEQSFARKLQFGTWVIQCKPGHPAIREMVSKITEFTLKRKKEDDLLVNVRNDVNVMNWTGAGVWTDNLFYYFNDYLKSGLSTKVSWKIFHKLTTPMLLSDVLIFPTFTFNAPAKSTSDDPYKPFYFCVHQNKKSWKNIPQVEN